MSVGPVRSTAATPQSARPLGDTLTRSTLGTWSTQAQTGVEMEALSAVSVAALTVYDMCKALSKGITIADIR